jgi:hypothetical protein
MNRPGARNLDVFDLLKFLERGFKDISGGAEDRKELLDRNGANVLDKGQGKPLLQFIAIISCH